MDAVGDEQSGPVSVAPAADTGLIALCLIARHLGVPANPMILSRHHLMAGTVAGKEDLIRIARRLELRGRLVKTHWDRLAKTPLPAIVLNTDGQFSIISRVIDGRAAVHSPGAALPHLLERSEFEAAWTGELILLTKRFSPTSLANRFDLRWFLSAVHRYRYVLSEVLVASFFLQMLGLVSPLFFQVVVDKVLVHRGLSTLDVLMIGLAIVSLFEVTLGALRTYVFSHTTNRIDVELGARLFDHLLGLPLAYFANRRVGDSVARVRELENIRNFITGSALTLTIDLFFTFVFLGVMYLYSPLLTWIVIASLPVYVIISVILTPVLRRRLDEKFARGADNQAFLVESVSGAETIKAMAVEPQMQRRWEDQLAGYVRASFRAQTLGNIGGQSVQFINKVTIVATLYLGAKLVMAGELTVGELVAFNMLAARVAQPVLRIAQLWQDFQQARLSIARLGDILNTQREPAPESCGLATVHPGRHPVRKCHLPLSVERANGAVRCVAACDARPGYRHRWAVGVRQVHLGQAGAAPLRAGIRSRTHRRRRSCHGRHRLVTSPDRRRVARQCSVQLLGAGEYRPG